MKDSVYHGHILATQLATSRSGRHNREIRLDTASAPAGNGLLFDNSLNYVGLRIDGLM